MFDSIIANQMTPGVFQSTRKESSNLLATIEYWNQMHIDMHVEVTKWNCIWCRQKLKKLLLRCHEEIWNSWWKAKFPIDNLFDSVSKKVHGSIAQLFKINLGDSDVGDLMMVTNLRCWWQNHYVCDFFRYVGGFSMY